MSRSVKLLIGILFLVIAAVVYFRSGNKAPGSQTKDQQEMAPVVSEPQYDWSNIFDKQVKINNGGIVTVRIHDTKKVRIAMTADNPVRMAMVEGRVERNIIQSIDNGEVSCSESQATSVSRECDIPNGAANLLFLYKDGTQPEQTLNIKVDAWQCKSNCQ